MAKLGRDILVTFGLITLVQVGFEQPVLRGLPNGTAIVSTRVSGAITEELIPLLEKSVPVTLVVQAELYARAGTRTAFSLGQRIEYRSLELAYVVTKNNNSVVHRNIDSAIADLETFDIEIPSPDFKSIVLHAALSIPSIADTETVASLWRGKNPTVVFSPGNP